MPPKPPPYRVSFIFTASPRASVRSSARIRAMGASTSSRCSNRPIATAAKMETTREIHGKLSHLRSRADVLANNEVKSARAGFLPMSA